MGFNFKKIGSILGGPIGMALDAKFRPGEKRHKEPPPPTSQNTLPKEVIDNQNKIKEEREKIHKLAEEESAKNQARLEGSFYAERGIASATSNGEQGAGHAIEWARMVAASGENDFAEALRLEAPNPDAASQWESYVSTVQDLKGFEKRQNQQLGNLLDGTTEKELLDQERQISDSLKGLT